MKRILLSVLRVIFFFSISGMCFSNEVTLRADSWYPINGNPGSNNSGYMIDIIQSIFSKHGHTIDYKEMPWARSLAMVREGTFDCVVGASKEDAPDLIYPSLSMGKLVTYFSVKQDDPWRFSDINSLQTRSLGVTAGYVYGDDLDNYIKKNQSTDKISSLAGNNSLDQNIKKLMSGRINTIIETGIVMKSKLKELNITDLVEAGAHGEESNIYMACTPNKPTSQQYIDLINTELPVLRSSGELAKILDKYGLKDWE